MEHEHFEKAAPIYAAGGLDSRERQEFEEHLQTGCSICLDRIKEYQETVGFNPDPSSSVPSSTLTETPNGKNSDHDKKSGVHLANKTRSKTGILSYASRVSPRSIFTVVLLGMLVTTTIYALTLRSDLRKEMEQKQQVEGALKETTGRIGLLRQQMIRQKQVVTALSKQQRQQLGDLSGVEEQIVSQQVELKQLREQLVKQARESTRLRQTLEQKEAVVELLLLPRVKVVSFRGKTQSPAKAFLLFDPKRNNGLFYAYNLTPLPEGKVYQLWAMAEKPLSMGTFSLDGGRKGRMYIKNLAHFSPETKFAVSIEPTGGRLKPRGDLHLVGPI